jgi:hypothetical protein
MLWLAAGVLLLGQATPDQKRIDAAIRRGIEFLKGAGSPSAYNPDDAWHIPDSDELILLTLVHGDVEPGDPTFQKYLKRALEEPLHKNYKVCLQAMALEEIDRATYQGRIAQCAQHLVDNICQNGQWGYGNPSPVQKGIPTGGRKGVSSGGVREYGPADGGRVKSPPNSKISISQTRFGGESGDNSNSQYAALGLRACHDANVVVPRATIALARKWWESALQMDKDKDNKVATGAGISVPPGGWGYRLAHNKEPYASMTAGATGALVIYDYILEKDWKKDPVVNAGLSWMAAHFSVDENTGGPSHGGSGPKGWLYYYLYALERLGILYDTETIGGHNWYAEGAKDLLEAQKPDGSWDASHYKQPVWDTCFAILFLKKATRPLVASEDRVRKR